jgi:ligand-binding sensor domain-containing protein
MGSITRARDGTMWFGTLGGLTRFADGAFVSYDEDDGLPHNLVFAVLEDRAARLWVGTQTGLALRHGDRFETFTTAHGLIQDRVYCLCEAADGALWLGTEGGVSRRDPETGTFRNWTTADGFAGDDTNAICQDSAGRMWIGAETGLSCWDGHAFTTYTVEQGGLPSNSVQSVVTDDDGVVRVAISEGLWRWQDGDVRVYTTADGLASDQVLRLMIDGTGYLWLATWGGVNRFDGEVF